MNQFKKAVRLVFSASLLLALAFVLAGCAGAGGQNDAQPEPEQKAQPVEVRVASMKGPTSMGMVAFMDEAKAGEVENDCKFSIVGTADEIVPNIVKGDFDIALVPANMASVLYKKTEGGVAVVDINTLGVLSVVTGDRSVASFSDLAGRTVYLTGKGTTPEYVMNHLLSAAGIADSVTLEYKSEAPEVVAALAADPMAVGVLPEPFVTAACAKNEQLSAVIGLTQVWDEIAGDSGSQLVTGVTVVRREFADEHPDAVKEFLACHAESAKAVTSDPAAWAQAVVDAGIVDSAPVAERAIPGCNIVCLTGDDMKAALSGYLTVLHAADPASVGGGLPADDFYLMDVEG